MAFAIKDVARLRVTGRLTGWKLAVMYHIGTLVGRGRIEAPKDWIIL